MKKPRIFHQPEKSYHCGACSTASVLDWFGEEPDPIPFLYKQMRGEGQIHCSTGMYASTIQSYFLRKDWVCLVNNSGGPYELDKDGRNESHHEHTHQRIATWRIIKQMLQDGYMCILEFYTNANTNHFAVVYDAFIKRNIYWLRIACSSQGYMEVQAEDFLKKTGTTQVFIKPQTNEYR